jgi:hypothetical protein
MSRKDYVALAAAIRDVWDLAPEYPYNHPTLRVVVLNLCDVFKRDNSNFDRERFIKAATGE